MSIHSSHERQYFYFILLLSKGIGPVAITEIRQALAFSGVSDEECGQGLIKGVVHESVLLKTKHREAILHALEHTSYEQFREATNKGEWVVCPEDRSLPVHYWDRARRFRLPCIFIAKGTLPPTDISWVAVIGSRNASAGGLERARAAGFANACAGKVTVSGGARGVDSVAVRSAMESGGWTVVVPAGDFDACRPQERQLTISPYAPGTPFTPGLAMARNAVVVALSASVTVAEVQPGRPGNPSGTEHAIELAHKYDINIQ